MYQRTTYNRIAQLIVVLLCALTLKLGYSTASPNELRWILAPTTFLVELVSGTSFKFESHAGYISSDRSFLIAASCAGVNFLITSFLMLSLSKLWRDGSQNHSHNPSHNPPCNRSNYVAWGFIPAALLFAYLATLVANTVRISTALRLQRMELEIGWLLGKLNANQLHRLQGIFIYFGFLLLLFLVSEQMSSKRASEFPRHTGALHERGRIVRHRLRAQLRLSIFPLLIYYATTLGIPLANGAYRTGTVAMDFWEHSVFVLLTPLLLILPLATFRFYLATLRPRKEPRVPASKSNWVRQFVSPRFIRHLPKN